MWIDPESFHPHHPRASTDRAGAQVWNAREVVSIKPSSRRSLLGSRYALDAESQVLPRERALNLLSCFRPSLLQQRRPVQHDGDGCRCILLTRLDGQQKLLAVAGDVPAEILRSRKQALQHSGFEDRTIRFYIDSRLCRVLRRSLEDDLFPTARHLGALPQSLEICHLPSPSAGTPDGPEAMKGRT